MANLEALEKEIENQLLADGIYEPKKVYQLAKDMASGYVDENTARIIGTRLRHRFTDLKVNEAIKRTRDAILSGKGDQAELVKKLKALRSQAKRATSLEKKTGEILKKSPKLSETDKFLDLPGVLKDYKGPTKIRSNAAEALRKYKSVDELANEASKTKEFFPPVARKGGELVKVGTKELEPVVKEVAPAVEQTIKSGAGRKFIPEIISKLGKKGGTVALLSALAGLAYYALGGGDSESSPVEQASSKSPSEDDILNVIKRIGEKSREDDAKLPKFKRVQI